MLMLFGLTISAPLPQGVTTSVRLRGTSLTWPAAAWAATVGVGAAAVGAAGAVVGLAAAVGAGCAAVGAPVGAAAGGGAVAAGGGAWGALVHAVASNTSPNPRRANGCLRGVTTILPSLFCVPAVPQFVYPNRSSASVGGSSWACQSRVSRGRASCSASLPDAAVAAAESYGDIV